MTNTKEEALKERLTSVVVPATTEGLVIRVRKDGRTVADLQVGKTYKYYDLASLTKIIFANSALMMLFESGKLDLRESIHNSLPWLKFRNIIIKELLTHSAGLSWWKPLYKIIKATPKHQLPNIENNWEQLKKILNSEKPKKLSKAVYSDLDYFVLGFLLQRKFEKPLLSIWAEVQDHLGLSGMHFNTFNHSQFSKSSYAPTESCPWRKKILQGEVHDDNTWALGGVSTHAGLFGSLDQVDEWFLKMRSSYLGRGPLKKQTLKTFWSRSLPENAGDWALGYMMPSANSSAGRRFSKSSVGHTGFTGTSFWYDLKKDFAVIMLSNRVHPTRENTMFVNKRAIIHDWCYELFA